MYPLRMILPVTTTCLFSRCTRKSTVLPLSESSKDSESAIILLEHLNRMFATRITQNDRIRLQLHSDIGHLNLVRPRLQGQGQFLANDGEILVIDGERRLQCLISGQTRDIQAPAYTRCDGSRFLLGGGTLAQRTLNKNARGSATCNTYLIQEEG